MLAVQMDTIPFHWDTLDAPQCLRMACLCPDECHEGWLCRKLLCFKYLLVTGSAAYLFRQRQSRHRRRNKRHPAAKDQALRGARLKALLALDFCLCMRGHSCNSFIQMHICWAAHEFHRGEAFQRDHSCNSPDSQYATTDTCRSTQVFPPLTLNF